MVGDVRTKVNRHQGPLQSILLEAPPANPATVRSTKIWTTLAPSQLLHYHLRLWASSCVLFDLDFVGSTHIAAIGLIDRHKVAFVALSSPASKASGNCVNKQYYHNSSQCLPTRCHRVAYASFDI